MRPRALILAPYFGPLPPWFRLFVQSCAYNPEFHFMLITDQDCGPLPENMRLLRMTFPDYRALVGARLGVKVEWSEAYKICDIKPVLGLVHADSLKGYSFWGYCDIDVIFGRLSRFYDDALFEFDVISSRTWLLSGHLALFRNTPDLLHLFTAIQDWQTCVSQAEFKYFSEINMAALLYGSQIFREMKYAPECRLPLRVNGRQYRSLFREQYPTWLQPQLWKDATFRMPGHFEWRAGVLTAPFLDGAELAYLHFNCWSSARSTRRERAPWAELPRLIDPAIGDSPEAFSISAAGFGPLAAP